MTGLDFPRLDFPGLWYWLPVKLGVIALTTNNENSIRQILESLNPQPECTEVAQQSLEVCLRLGDFDFFE